ncbi:dihydrofolate reductase family protein [Kitasatospora purpeofusca]|uniref:Dihydrofolate reductase family protein n=1 Tax=Kitasatospora purpeofusca TaxID=67352 RepID=A0ABZ1TV65_9ACTN|nr:dihydrofolate reductase family protein [Kitasatospora purpeofusca]WTA50100.1 dihydrofolate reductase family protein [Kitasatospora purpeofusca]
MAERPYVLLSVATSVDGHIDDTSPQRLLLSNAEDFDRVDQVRAESDAILIGGNTLRSDNPRLLVNSEKRRADRVAAGKSEYPIKVTITASGDLSRGLKFWYFGDQKVVYTTDDAVAKLREELDGLADVVSTGPTVDFGAILDDLGGRGVERLMVEGGGQIHTQFLSQNLADEVHLAIAPLLVGQAQAPRFIHPAEYPGGSRGRMKLLDATTIGDVVLLRYAPKQRIA